MPRIQFAKIEFPDPAHSRDAIYKRFKKHARERAMGRKGICPADQVEPDVDNLEVFDEWLSFGQLQSIGRRASQAARRYEQASPLFSLKDLERKRILTLSTGVPIIPIPSEHRADEIAAVLHQAFPWMQEANELVWYDMRASAQSESPGLRIPPLLLNGPPGIGKSTWCRKLAELVGVPSLVIDATGEGSGFSVSGLQRGWSNAEAGRPLDLILRERVANPIIVVDEIEKAGSPSSTRDRSPTLVEALLPLLEPGSAQHWNCPFFRIPFDMSWISWILTSNGLSGLPAPFLSRCRVLHVTNIAIADLQAFAHKQAGQRGLSEASITAICDALQQMRAAASPPNLRVVSRMLDRAQVLERRVRLH